MATRAAGDFPLFAGSRLSFLLTLARSLRNVHFSFFLFAESGRGMASGFAKWAEIYEQER